MKFFIILFSLLYSSYSLQESDLHAHWKRYFERKFAIANLFPFIKQLAGSDGLVLEVGCENYNQYDVRFAEMDPSRWYFVDVVRRHFADTVGGTQIVYPRGFRDMNDQQWKGKFRVIYDNILQFFANATNSASLGPVEIREHISMYPKLIQSGGWLLMKIDGWNPRNFENWPIFKKLLSQSGFVLTQAVVQVTNICGPRSRADFQRWETEIGPHIIYDLHVNYTATCERTIWAQFYYPGQSLIWHGERDISNL